MPGIDIGRAVPIETADQFDDWLRAHTSDRAEVTLGIYKLSSGRAAVGLAALQEVALCHGWVDTQTKRIDDERYAIRFVPRRPRSTWSPKNREMARRMLAADRVTERGIAVLPDDLQVARKEEGR